MKVRWSPRALIQLREAHTYIAGDNRGAARTFLEAVTILSERVAEYPGMGLETDESGVIVFPLIRYRYLIFYKILSSGIRIIRIRHGSRKS